MLLWLRFFVSGLAVLLVSLPAVIAMFCLTPLLLCGSSGEKLYFKSTRSICGFVWSTWAWVPFGFWKTPFTCNNEKALVEDLKSTKRIIVLANHRSWSDIFVLFWLARKAGQTKQSVYLAKRSLLYLPVIGWGMYLSGMLMLRRNWKADKSMLRKASNRFRKHDFGYWVYIYPEGSRRKQANLEASQGFQRARGLPVFSQVLQPRPKGFAALVSEMPKLEAVLNVTIAYDDDSGRFARFLAGKCTGVHIHARLDQPPSDPESYLQKSFVEKEAWLNDFHR